MKNTKSIIKKWYDALGFPRELDADFAKILDEYPISENTTIADLNKNREACAENLPLYLFCCEELKQKYDERGISEKIFLSTMYDIVIWTKRWSEVKGKLCLGELGWLDHHYNMRIFRTGRLQFIPWSSSVDYAPMGLLRGDDVLQVHITADGKLDPDECEASYKEAREFFTRLFPERNFKCFLCYSWLLDSKLNEYFPQNSNILRFQEGYERVREDDNNESIMKFMFPWDTDFKNLPEREPRSSVAARVKAALLSGEQFHATVGARRF